MKFLDRLIDGLQTLIVDTWNWFIGLNQQEWIIVLAFCAALGFLCMRGMSSKGHV